MFLGIRNKLLYHAALSVSVSQDNAYALNWQEIQKVSRVHHLIEILHWYVTVQIFSTSELHNELNSSIQIQKLKFWKALLQS